jgi:hypothetical protein
MDRGIVVLFEGRALAARPGRGDPPAQRRRRGRRLGPWAAVALVAVITLLLAG